MRRHIAVQIVTTVLDVAGVLAVAGGCALIYPPLGLVVIGAACLVLSRWGSR